MTLKIGSSSKSNQFFSCPNNTCIAVQVWLKSAHSFRRQGAGKPFSKNLSLSVTLKTGSRSPKSNQFFSVSQQYRYTSLVKIHSFRRLGADKPFSNLSPHVTLKMGSRLPKSNQFFYMSQQYRCLSLVKIHLFPQEIGCREAIFQHLKPSCDLENGVKVTKI